MTAGSLRVDGVADRLGRQREGAFGFEAAVHLPQIVEGDGRHRTGRQRSGGIVLAHPAQQAVAHSAIGNQPKAVLDPCQCPNRVAVAAYRKADRIQRREPAHRSGEIDIATSSSRPWPSRAIRRSPAPVRGATASASAVSRISCTLARRRWGDVRSRTVRYGGVELCFDRPRIALGSGALSGGWQIEGRPGRFLQPEGGLPRDRAGRRDAA